MTGTYDDAGLRGWLHEPVTSVRSMRARLNED
jgi:hypothetical protein